MAYFEDLSSCSYFGEELTPTLTAVGWLTSGRPFPRGDVSEPAYTCLAQACAKPWEPAELLCMGFHNCELCTESAFRCANNLYIPDKSGMFVAPVATIHYVDVHRYRPPDEFLNAVVACGEIGSERYFAAVRRTRWAKVWATLWQDREETGLVRMHEALKRLSLDERLKFERLLRLEER